jgi:putative FmdB family regulatory protein
MPLYEYECEACGHRFEAIQRFSDPPLERCPRCGGALQKLQSAPAFQFKGTGWYVTDYARKDQSPGSKDDQGKPAPAEGAKEGAADAPSGAKDAPKTEKSAAASESAGQSTGTSSAPSTSTAKTGSS